MASSRTKNSSNVRNSDLSKRSSCSSSSSLKRQHQVLTDASKFASTMTVDGILRDVYNTTTADATLLDTRITLVETNGNMIASKDDQNDAASVVAMKSVDEVWSEIVSGERKEMKEEVLDEMMTLEDFLVKAGAVDDADGAVHEDVKAIPTVMEPLSGGVYTFDQTSPFQVEGPLVGFRNGGEVVNERGKRSRVMLEQMDKAAQRRQRRMIKNRESAARSRERKQAERTKERYKQLKEKVIPVVEKKRPPCVFRRVRSMEW